MLILGSGFTTHNLSLINMSAGPDAAPPSGSTEFDDWAAETIATRDIDAVIDFLHRHRPHRDHPRTEHFAPLFVSPRCRGRPRAVDARRSSTGSGTACPSARGSSPDARFPRRSRCQNRGMHPELPSVDDYLASLDAAVDRMAVWSHAAGPDAPVPTCPGWTVRDLLAHQGMVHRWATAVVRADPADVDDVAVEAEGRAAPNRWPGCSTAPDPSSPPCRPPPTTWPS